MVAHASGQRVVHAAERALGAFAGGAELTRRGALQDGIADPAAWLEAIASEIPEVITFHDADGRLIGMNRRARELAFRASRDGEMPELDVRLPSGQPASSADLPLVEALRSRSHTAGGELDIVRQDGSTLRVVATAGPVLDGGGELIGGVLVFEDVSRLRDAERQAAEWISIIAHDLRQPISVMMMSASQLAKKQAELGPELGRRAERVLIAVQRLNRMIGDLLDASRIEAGRLRIQRRPGSLLQLVEAAAASLRPLCAIRVEARGELPAIPIDPARVEQALSHLLSNAIQYGEPGAAVEVVVEGLGHEQAVSVTNRGPGLESHELDRVFERFYRGSSAEGTDADGLGLGLYVARGLIEAHGGRMTVESVPGETTTFRFALPMT